MKNPNHLFYTKEHEWADIKDNEILIGITDYAQGQLGDVIFIEFPEIGLEMNAGDIFGEIEAVKTVSELFAPVSGTITEVNEKLENNPDLVNKDPYGDGWLIKVTPKNPDERGDLMNSISYDEFVG